VEEKVNLVASKAEFITLLTEIVKEFWRVVGAQKPRIVGGVYRVAGAAATVGYLSVQVGLTLFNHGVMALIADNFRPLFYVLWTVAGMNGVADQTVIGGHRRVQELSIFELIVAAVTDLIAYGLEINDLWVRVG